MAAMTRQEWSARYHRLFEGAPISIWEEDFSEVVSELRALRDERGVDIAEYLRGHPERIQGYAARVRVVEVNPAALALCEAESREALLGGLDKVFLEESLATFGEQLIALASGATMWEGEGVHGTLSGGRLDVVVRLLVTPDADPPYSSVIIAITDETARRRAESERREFAARMERTQRLESLGVLAGGVAHDFNNILMGVLGNAELALLDLEEGSGEAEAVRAIRASAQRAAEICQQMLVFSGRASASRRRIELGSLIEEFAPLLESGLAKSALLIFEIEQQLPAVMGDSTYVRQLLIHLVRNASDALEDPGGQILVKSSACELDEASLARLDHAEGLASGAYVCLEVRDDGEGIREDVRPRIFEPFFTTRFAGRGLGLPAVLGIVRALRAGLEVASQPGEGTTVRVYFPRANEERSTQGDIDDTLAQATVLLVDDEPAVRSVGRRMLERCGVGNPLIASSGGAALELLDGGEEVDLVVLDLQMPGMSGEEVWWALRERSKSLPVLLSSGFGEGELPAELAADPCAAFLQKPYRLDTLRHALERLWSSPRKE